MKRILFILISAVSIAFALPLVAQGQQWYRGNLPDTIKQLEDDADRFQGSLDTDLDHSRLNGTPVEDMANRYVDAFEGAADRLKNRYDDQGYAPGMAREVLARGRDIDRFMRRHHPGRQSGTDWLAVRKSLTRLASAYRIPWRW